MTREHVRSGVGRLTPRQREIMDEARRVGHVFVRADAGPRAEDGSRRTIRALVARGLLREVRRPGTMPFWVPA